MLTLIHSFSKKCVCTITSDIAVYQSVPCASATSILIIIIKVLLGVQKSQMIQISVVHWCKIQVSHHVRTEKSVLVTLLIGYSTRFGLGNSP